MSNRETFHRFGRQELHKGFYVDSIPDEALYDIKYSDFFEYPEDDDDFPYYFAHALLCGSCHHFALSLQKLLGYKAYIIEGINERSFHAFCQIYRAGTWFYVDARGITSSFTEFMDIAKQFVSDEYVIRPVNSEDIAEWEEDSDYNTEAYAFAEAVISKYKQYYTMD